MALQLKVIHVGYNVPPLAPQRCCLEIGRKSPFVSVDHWMMRCDPYSIDASHLGVDVLRQALITPPYACNALGAEQSANLITHLTISNLLGAAIRMQDKCVSTPARRPAATDIAATVPLPMTFEALALAFALLARRTHVTTCLTSLAVSSLPMAIDTFTHSLAAFAKRHAKEADGISRFQAQLCKCCVAAVVTATAYDDLLVPRLRSTTRMQLLFQVGEGLS